MAACITVQVMRAPGTGCGGRPDRGASTCTSPLRPARRAPALSSDLDRELAAEQAYLTRLYAQLDLLRDRAATQLDRVRREPSGNTPAGRAEKDAFDALHSQRLQRLSAVEDRLAFGRLDLTGGERRYVGRIGLSDDDQSQLLLDWRAPAAAAFYQATAAAPGGVARRRHLATKDRRVTGLDDELLDADALPEGAVTITGDGALMSALTAHRTGRMRDIVATLQTEQDAVVRAPLDGVLVVQGGPGTGKTAVALHRAAYLLYTHRERIARRGVLVVGPSPVFLRYIEQVLPSLGETGVLLATPDQLYPGVEATGTEAAEVAALKGDPRMASLVRAAVRARQRVPSEPVRLRTEGGDVLTLRPSVVVEARSRARQTGRPHNEARVTFVKHVLDDLANRLAKARGQRLEDDDLKADLLAELRSSKDVRREVNLCWMPLTATGMLSALLAHEGRLATAADGILSRAEQAMLLRERDAGWTAADIPLLDEAAELIGTELEADAAAQAQAPRDRAAQAEALEYARGVLQISGDAGGMVTAEMLADRFNAGGPDYSLAERAHADRTWVFGHAVVDEAQELSAMAWRVIARRVPSRSMTIVGDLAQTGSAAGSSSWQQVRDVLRPAHWQLAELTVNYRTPAEVMAVAAATAEHAGLPVTPPKSAREGSWPPVAVRLGSEPDAAAVLAAVRTDDEVLGGGRIAVVAPAAQQPALADAVAAGLATDPALAERVSVLTVTATKGLEFDAVVLVDPAAVLAASPHGAGDLYVALTRCTQRLTVLHRGDLPGGLDQLEATPALA
jgi:DNA helicase IV